MHFAQQLLKRQFPHLNGLQPTVLQAKKSLGTLPNQLQVIHSCGDHWILASNIGCRNGDVSMYDSVYRSIDKETRAVITNLFQSSTLKLVESQKQEGGADCGICHSYSYCSCSWNQSIKFQPVSNEKAPSTLFQGRDDETVSMLLMFYFQLYMYK